MVRSASRRWPITLVAISAILVGCRATGDPLSLEAPSPVESVAASTSRAEASVFDCVPAGTDCPEIVIEGDAPAEMPNGTLAPFRGYSDPTVRADPESGRIWLAYSRPSVVVHGGRPGTRVESFIAHSDDDGQTWLTDGVLWGAREVTNPVNGQVGSLDVEVPNLYPLVHDNGVTWIGVRLQLFVPSGGTLGQRPITSFHLAVSQSPSPTSLAGAPVATLGAAGTAPGWDVTQDLSALHSSLRDCLAWNEPALTADGNTLYLALRCLAFDRRAGIPDVEKSRLVLFATTPRGEATTWEWRFVGEVAGHTKAVSLGGEGLTQVDFAQARDGALLMIVTPDDWHDDESEFVHYGIRVLEVESLEPCRLRRDRAGDLIVRASITASDQLPLGPGAAAYEPASETGVLLMRRQFGPGSLIASIHDTGVHP